MEGKRAVLFADVSGSAKLYERLGDAEAERAVDRCIKRMERAIEGFDGRLVKSAGDEIMVVFDTAEAACQAAQEMQQRVSDLPPVSGVKLAIRIGLHVGPAAGNGGDVAEEVMGTAARIVGLAQAGQILTSSDAVAHLPAHLREDVRDAAAVADGRVQEVVWQKVEEHTLPPAMPKVAKPAPTAPTRAAAPAANSAVRLCLRYHGRAYLVDEKTPILALGRDAGSDIVIEDRKASRHHARIERRDDRFVYVDRSTNGSYVAMTGMQETMVRRTEIVLQGSGSICFGASGNDPAADCATFEHL